MLDALPMAPCEPDPRKLRTQLNRGAAFEPTEAVPGTEEKLLLLERRADNRQPLFHQNDYRKTYRVLTGFLAR
jgi:hypothetical protein